MISQRWRESSESSQDSSSVPDLHLVGVDGVEVAGQRRPAGHRVDRLEHPRFALLAADPVQVQALAHLLEQVGGGDAGVRHGLTAIVGIGLPNSRPRSASTSGASRSASRNPSLEKRSASSDRISRYCCDECSGTLIANTRSTGAWSRAPKSTGRSEEHTSELQSLMRISYAVFCLKQNNMTS